MLKILKTGFFLLQLLLVHSVLADSLTDLTEVYTAEEVPKKEQRKSSDFHGMVGAGLFNYEKIVGDSGRRNILLPIVIVTYQDWAYWSIGGGGVWLYQSEDRSVKLGVGLKVHRGFEAEDEDVYAGMNERRRSLDGSVNALWKTELVNTSFHYYHDIGKASKGASATLKFSHAFPLSPRLRLIPNIGAEWVSTNVVDYYFGVAPAEATPTRPAYTGQETVNYSAGLNATYFVDREWLLLGGVHVTQLGSGIVDSPLVSKSNSSLAYFGAVWLF